MKVIQAYWQNNTWTYIKPKLKLNDPLVLVFAEFVLFWSLSAGVSVQLAQVSVCVLCM